MSGLVTRSSRRAFGGVQGFYEHTSAAVGGPMRFSVFLPPQAERGPVPAVYALAGLECNEETFAAKAGAQRVAAALGLAIVTGDTSPRAARFPGDDASWELGQGAGFYVDATEAPWSSEYQMATYWRDELPGLVEAYFPIARDRRGVLGHSMGGHGALTLALRNPERYASCSAFAPIVAPSQVRWGQQAFTAFLGADRARWAAWDATALLAERRCPGTIRIDQGTDDKFLGEQLRPELFAAAAGRVGQGLELYLHPGYDHGYYFVATFVEAHLRHHAAALLG